MTAEREIKVLLLEVLPIYKELIELGQFENEKQEREIYESYSQILDREDLFNKGKLNYEEY